jgi:hypothetical protein
MQSPCSQYTGQAEQKILVTGLTGPGNNSYSLELVRYLPNGTLDTSFNGTGRITTVLRSAITTATASQ